MLSEDFADFLSEPLGYWIESSACMGRNIRVNLVVVGGIVVPLDGKMGASVDNTTNPVFDSGAHGIIAPTGTYIKSQLPVVSEYRAIKGSHPSPQRRA